MGGHGLRDGLDKLSDAERAALFAIGPPFAARDATTEDCDRLGEYVEARVELLRDLLTVNTV